MVQHVFGRVAAVGAGDDPGGGEGGQEQQPGALAIMAGEIGLVMAGDAMGDQGGVTEGRRPGARRYSAVPAHSCKDTVNDPDDALTEFGQ